MKSSTRIIAKFCFLLFLAAGSFLIESGIKAKSYCPYEPAYICCNELPCPVPYNCQGGICVCACPDQFGNCPASCA